MTSKTTPRVRYAVVGLGNIAQVAVLPAFAHAKENSDLVALVSSDPEKLRELGKHYGVTLTGSYDDLETILEDGEVDAVYVAVPNALHCELAVRVAEAGAHILCEKPMAASEEECERMIDAARTAGVKLMIAYRLHFDEAHTRAIERIRAGDIGVAKIYSSVFCHQVREGNVRTQAEMAGGALFDMGIYCLNAARYLFQAEPVEVFAYQVTGADERSETVDDTTVAVLKFPDGRVAQMTASQGAADVSTLRVVGTKGDISIEPAFDYTTELAMHVTIGEDTKKKSFSKRDQFAPELVYFSQCVLDGSEPEPSGWQGLLDVRVMQAMVRSATTGSPVRLPPTEPPAQPDRRMAMRKGPVGKVTPIRAPSPSR
jgi:predicted dehydrogenase